MSLQHVLQVACVVVVPTHPQKGLPVQVTQGAPVQTLQTLVMCTKQRWATQLTTDFLRGPRSSWGSGGAGGEDAVVAEQLAIEEAIQYSLALEESRRQYEADIARRHNFTGVGSSRPLLLLVPGL